MYLFNFVTSKLPLSAKSIGKYGWEFIKSKNLNNNTFLKILEKENSVSKHIPVFKGGQGN